MGNKFRFVCILTIVMLLSSSCSYKKNSNEVITVPTITLMPEISKTPNQIDETKPTQGIQPTKEPRPTRSIQPTNEVQPTIDGEKEPTPIVNVTPTPSYEIHISPTPKVSEVPEITINPIPEVVITPMAPEPTKGATIIVTQAPTPTPFQLENAMLVDIVGSNTGASLYSQIIKNPLGLVKTQKELTQMLLEQMPVLKTYTRVDYETYEWNYYKTTDAIPMVNFVSSISTEGLNNKDQLIYQVGYLYNSEISDDPSSIRVIINDGFQTIEDGKRNLSKLLSSVLPKSYVDVMLNSKATAVTNNNTNISSVMNKTLQFKDTQFFMDFSRIEQQKRNQLLDGNNSLEVYAATNRSGLLYSGYRDGIVFHTEKFKEFPLDFNNFFLELNPFHKFEGVKFIKETSSKLSGKPSYTAEFDGNDMEGNYTAIMVSMEDFLGEYLISNFQYYTSFDMSLEGIDAYQGIKKASEHYANYLNQIMTLPTYRSEEFMGNLSGDKISLMKDVEVSGQIIPCNLNIYLQNIEGDSSKVIAHLEIEYQRQ